MKQCTCYALRAIDCTCKPAKYGELYTSPTAKQEQGEPVAWRDRNSGTLLHEEWLDADPLYITPQPKREPQDWSVFNTGAEVASGLTFDEAWDYLTDERLARGWSAVCVVNKDNLPIEAAHGIKE